MASRNGPPSITIVTPSFNQARYLRETIESIVGQDYPNLEYIIMDGGSDDGSVEIIREYQEHLAYWTSRPDRGQSYAIMEGLRHAKGELFAWVNSDDVLLPGCLEAIAKCYVEEDAPDIIHADVAYIDGDGAVTRFVRVPRQSRFFFFRGVWCATAPAIFFKTSSFLSIGGLDEAYHLSMDLDVWMRMMQAGAKVSHIPRYLGGFRWHDAAKTVASLRTRSTEENSETTEILNRYLERSTPRRRFFWRRLYKACQVMNLNYLKAHIDLKRAGGPRSLHEMVGQPEGIFNR